MVCLNSSVNFLIYYGYGSNLRKTWVQTYGFLWNNCMRACRKQNASVDPNVETVDTIINRNPKPPDDNVELMTSVYSPELHKFTVFRATHGPTMV